MIPLWGMHLQFDASIEKRVSWRWIASGALLLALCAGSTAKNVRAEREQEAVDFQHLELRLKVDAERRLIEGLARHRVRLSGSSVSRITLNARSSISIRSCRIDGKSVPFSHSSGLLQMSLEPPVRSLASIVLEIDYTVQKEANYGLHWTEPNDRDRDRTLGFWTVGETTYNSSWVPINDRPDDFITSDVTVDAPSHWTVIGNGRAIVEPPKNDAVRKVFRWKMDQPHASYLLSLVAGELAVKEDRRGRVPLIYTGPKGTDALLVPTFGRTPEMIAVFERLFRTPYPFAKYAQKYDS